MTTKHTPRESYWRGHWAAIDGSAIATPNDDAEAFARGAERGAAALAEAMRCKTYRERWAWIGWYVRQVYDASIDSFVSMPDTYASLLAVKTTEASWKESDR